MSLSVVPVHPVVNHTSWSLFEAVHSFARTIYNDINTVSLPIGHRFLVDYRSDASGLPSFSAALTTYSTSAAAQQPLPTRITM
jgi:hypothetical protein